MRIRLLTIGAVALGVVGAASGCGTSRSASVTASTSAEPLSASTETTSAFTPAAPSTTVAPPVTTQAVTAPTTHAAAPATTHVAPTTHAVVAPRTTAPKAPVVSKSCSASMSNSHPGDGGDVTVIVHTTASAAVKTYAHYKTTTHEHDGTAGSSGTANITFSIGRPTVGYPVEVDVTTSSGQSCSTEFTPE